MITFKVERLEGWNLLNLIFTQFEPHCQVKVLVFDLDLLLVEAARDATARFSETAASIAVVRFRAPGRRSPR